MPTCNYNVGQKLTLTVTEVAGQNVGIIWELWDDTIARTPPGGVPQLDYTLNRSGEVSITAVGVDDLGRSMLSTYMFYVNQPPIVTSVGVTNNYTTFPFLTTVSATANDPDGDTSLISWDFYYINENNVRVELLGTTAASQFGPSFNAGISVSGPMHVYLSATDVDGGVTVVEFDLSGIEPISRSTTPLGMTITPVDGQLIGPDSYITCSVVVADPGTPTFDWTFWGHDSTDHGTTVEIAPGLWCNTIKRGTVDAKLPSVKRSVVQCGVTFSDGRYTAPLIQSDVLLYQALPPSYQIFATVSPAAGVVPGTALTYEALAVNVPDAGIYDADGYSQRGGDSLYYKWTISLPLDFPEEYLNVEDYPETPSTPVENNVPLGNRTLTLYGSKVKVSTSSLLPGDKITATLVVQTNLGGELYSSPPQDILLQTPGGTVSSAEL